MSSHHIVREKQEPALLILGLDNFSDELLGQLLEWSPTVITTLQPAEKMVAFGIKVDWIITNIINEQLQADIKRLPEGSGTLAEDALKYLVANGFPSVNVITDEFDVKDYMSFADKINLVVFYNYKKIYPAKTGFSKWKPAGEIVELLTQPANIHTAGLKIISDNKYQTSADGFFSLQFEEKFLFIAEEL